MNYEIYREKKKYKIRDLNSKYEVDLGERLFQFALDVIRFLGKVPNRMEFDVFKKQLSKSATSIGANYQEAQGAYSKNEFASKIGICLKEAKETFYFFKLLNALMAEKQNECLRLTKEVNEIQKILAVILIKVRKK
jgi:four helix bundle protein